MLIIAEGVRQVLVPFLVIGTALLLALLVLLVGQRLMRAAAGVRRAALSRQYRPVISAALDSDARAPLDALAKTPVRHRGIVAELLLATLRVVRGEPTERAAEVAERVQLSPGWRADLNSRRWWHRSEAALALGLVRDRQSVATLVSLLDDDHEQVRAAAIDALGEIGDVAAVPALLARMDDRKRLERTRVVQALRALGPLATAALIEHGESRPEDRREVGAVLAHIGGAAAAGPLLEWSTSGDADSRAAVWRALASIGLDDRAFYHALKALNDEAPAVRAAAAMALARSGRTDATAHLARRLDDDWEVAAQSARALAAIGSPGVAALTERAEAGPGLGQDLARQMLWEQSGR